MSEEMSDEVNSFVDSPDSEQEDLLSSNQNETTSSRELKRLVATAATTAATLGYDVGIMAAAIQPIEAEFGLNSFRKELAMGSLNFIAAAGALWGGVVANKRGRKPTITLACWLFVIGTVSMALAPNYEILLTGRIITGLGVGVAVVVTPVFLTEVAPTEKRGQINTIFDVAINGGILLGYIVGFCVQVFPVPYPYKWRLMLGLGLVLPIVILWYLSLLPESPRWLVMANQPGAAKEVLEHLGQSPQESSKTVKDIQDELEKECCEEPVHWFGSGPRLAAGLGFWQQATGTEAVLYYSADFLKQAGLDSPVKRLLGNVFVGLCKLGPELLAMRFVDQLGRRPLMIGSAVALTVTMSALGGAFYWSLPPMAVVILLSAVMASYSVGVGPFSFLVASENLGLSERATGMTLCATVNRCMSGAVALTTVSLYEALGDAGFFALYASIAALSICFYARSVPESTGLSLEELAARNRGDDCSITSMSISSDEANVESFKLFNANPSTFEIQLT
jgi:sugar porter (SP) family MFS transporter